MMITNTQPLVVLWSMYLWMAEWYHSSNFLDDESPEAANHSSALQLLRRRVSVQEDADNDD